MAKQNSSLFSEYIDCLIITRNLVMNYKKYLIQHTILFHPQPYIHLYEMRVNLIHNLFG